MARRKVKLVHECFSKHSRMGTAGMKLDKETEEGWKRGVSMEKSTVGTTNKRSHSRAYHYLI